MSGCGLNHRHDRAKGSGLSAGQERLGQSGRANYADRFDGVAGPPARCRGAEGGCRFAWVSAIEVDGEVSGRSRGGPTSKVHLAVDSRGLPMSVISTPGLVSGFPRLLPENVRAVVSPGRSWVRR